MEFEQGYGRANKGLLYSSLDALAFQVFSKEKKVSREAQPRLVLDEGNTSERTYLQL